MRKAIITIGILTIVSVVFAGTMNIHMNDGTTVNIEISEIYMITFEPDSIIFYDDFEDDTIGMLPSKWEVKYSGEEIIIDYDPLNSTNQVLKLLGAPSWVASVYRLVDEVQEEDKIVESDMYLTSNATTDVNIGSFEYNGTYVGFATIDENTLKAKFSDGSQAGSFSANEWHHVKMVVDWDNSSYEAYIDGVLYHTGYFTPNTTQIWHYDMYLGSSNEPNSTRLLYFDNITEMNTSTTIIP